MVFQYAAGLGVLPAVLAASAVGTPRVLGPRSTTAERPVYRFRAAHAIAFRCAFDSRILHRCPARYAQHLEPGGHVLRVRAVGRNGALSRQVAVRILVKSPYPPLATRAPVRVGAGAGVPAVGGGSVWVPVTATGELVRIDPEAGSVTGRVTVARPPSGSGFLDSAAFLGGSVWSASDSEGTIARVDAASARLSAKLPVGSRPGGLAVGNGSVWAFHFLSPNVTQIDAAGTARTFSVGEAVSTGIAYGGGSLWLLTIRPAQVLRVDLVSGGLLGSIPLTPPFREQHAVIDTWWLSYGDGAVWATLPNYDAVARIDAATSSVQYARTPYGRPFGVTIGGGSAWVATDHGVLRLDELTAKPTGVALLPAATASGFVSISYGDGAAWFTNYDRGTLTRVSGAAAPRAEPVAKIHVGLEAGLVLPAAGSIWTSDLVFSRVVRIDPNTNAVTRRIAFGSRPFGLAYGAGSVWVSERSAGRLARINPRTNRIVKKIKIGFDSYGLAFGAAASG